MNRKGENMKLTIAITFWDKDQNNIPKLLNNIEENVKVEHEVITIDNREDTTTKLSFTPTYSFGYNARQFNARKKALELAKGEFIWFIDGDDEIMELNSISDHDIQVYQYTSNNMEVHFTEEEIVDFYNTKTFIDSYVPLWNKIFRKSLFDGFNLEADIITSEDVIYNLYAIRKAKSYKRFSKTIYHQNVGNSNNFAIDNVDVIHNVFYGYEKSIQLIKELSGAIEFHALEYQIFSYFMGMINKCTSEETVLALLDYLFKFFDSERINKHFIEFTYCGGFRSETIKPIFNYLKEHYPQYEWQKYIEVEYTMFDGSTKKEKRPLFDID